MTARSTYARTTVSHRASRPAQAGPQGSWLLILCGIACACGQRSGPAPGAPAAALELNVLLILVDDLRPALGCYGDTYARTPHIDRLASQGFLFERAYCQQALCHPSRTSLLVGARPDSTGVYDLRGDFRERLPEVQTLPGLFREHGWTTLALGKVHHGNGTLDDPASWSGPPWRPAASLGYFSPEGLRVAAERSAELDAMGREENVRGLAFEAAEVGDLALYDGMLLQEAKQRLAALTKQRFFLAVGFKKPHLPFVAPRGDYEEHARSRIPPPANSAPPAGQPECARTSFGELRSYYGMPREGPIAAATAEELVRGYYACTTFVDRLIGELLLELERLDLAQRTVVVLLGDHGFQLGENGQWCKHTNSEEATRAPWILRLPAGVLPGFQPGARSQAIVEFVDLYPTLAELCGLPLPPHLEGKSCLPLLSDPSQTFKRAALSQYPSLDPVSGREVMGYSLRDERYRYTEWRQGDRVIARELYDYFADPLLTRNWAGVSELAAVEARLAGWAQTGWRGLQPEETAR